MIMVQSSPQRNKIHPHKFTMWVAMASIVMMFAGLTSAYVVKSNQANWETVQIPTQFWVSTGVILAASLCIQMAVRAFKQKERSRYKGLLLVTGLLGIGFLLLQWNGFSWMWNHGVHFRGSGAGQFLYIIAGLHAIHVIGGLVALFIQLIRSLSRKTISYNSVPVEILATYWHFVDFLWLYLLLFFNLIK
ncbi:cytochrome c oxidase subunit 3 [Paraflavisolibacter sp. H34]|uniref:cytochrome c oxidase subunit 3 n=1 Tax=Huijunlia imazamoxiresistens TaxID=3127457 RepID=UPI003019DA13